LYPQRWIKGGFCSNQNSRRGALDDGGSTVSHRSDPEMRFIIVAQSEYAELMNPFRLAG